MLALALGLPADFNAMLGGTVAAALGGVVGITPGGLGIQELGWAGALELGGWDAEAITLFLVIQRVLFFLFFASLALLSRPLVGRAVGSNAEL